MKNYLMYNIQLLAYSAGYTVRDMLDELGINRNMGLFDPDRFAEHYQDRIEYFLRRQRKYWLMPIFEKSKLSIMDKVDGCVFANSYSSSDAFQKNISAIGYFLSVLWRELAEDLGCSQWRIQCMRDKPFSYDETEWGKIYEVLMRKYAKTDKEKKFLETATKRIILNQIPHSARNKPRNNYIPYNETQDKN